MFKPPEIVDLEVFAELPQEFRQMRHSEWADANQGGRQLDSFLEGPSFDAEGNLYVVDIPHGRIFRISPGGVFTLVSEYDGEPNGLKIHRDGRIFVADYKNGILLLNPNGGDVTPVLARKASERLRGPNDLFFAANGDLYFTDQGQTGLQDRSGRVYRLSAAGRLDVVLDAISSSERTRHGYGRNNAFCRCDESEQYLAASASAGRHDDKSGGLHPTERRDRP